MTSPTSQIAITRNDLKASLEEISLISEREGFIGLKVMPAIDVRSKADQFGRIPIEELLQAKDTVRAPDGGYARGNWKFEPDSYACIEHGYEEPVDEAEARIYGDWFDAEVISTERAYWQVLVNQEMRIAAKLYNTTTYTGSSLTTAITDEWDDYAAADPITDVNNAKIKVWQGCGLWPNAITLNETQFMHVRQCAQVIDALQAAGAGVSAVQGDFTEAMLAKAFGLKYVFVSRATKNTANKGQAFSGSHIWSSEYASVLRVAENPNDIKEPCVGRTFHYVGDGSTIGGTVETYRDESKRRDIVRVRQDVAEKTLIVQAAHLLSNVLTL